jgi:nucleotide-binding universal stress UspA family protein
MRFNHILFPTDFSERSRSAETHVRSMARHFGARLTILHTVEMSLSFASLPPGYFLETDDGASLLIDAGASLKEVLPEIEATRKAEIGDPAGVIADYAEAHEVDLIMMATHGLGTFRRTLVGSVASKVLHDSRCAVWTDTHVESANSQADDHVGKIVCAVDFSGEAVTHIKKAAELGRSFGAQVWLAHAVPTVRAAFYWEGITPEDVFSTERFYLDAARRRLAELQAQAGTAFEVCLLAGDIAEVVAEVAARHRADLILIGRGCAGHVLGSLRSHIFGIIQRAPVPVLSL